MVFRSNKFEPHIQLVYEWAAIRKHYNIEVRKIIELVDGICVPKVSY